MGLIHRANLFTLICVCDACDIMHRHHVQHASRLTTTTTSWRKQRTRLYGGISRLLRQQVQWLLAPFSVSRLKKSDLVSRISQSVGHLCFERPQPPKKMKNKTKLRYELVWKCEFGKLSHRYFPCRTYFSRLVSVLLSTLYCCKSNSTVLTKKMLPLSTYFRDLTVISDSTLKFCKRRHAERFYSLSNDCKNLHLCLTVFWSFKCVVVQQHV